MQNGMTVKDYRILRGIRMLAAGNMRGNAIGSLIGVYLGLGSEKGNDQTSHGTRGGKDGRLSDDNE